MSELEINELARIFSAISAAAAVAAATAAAVYLINVSKSCFLSESDDKVSLRFGLRNRATIKKPVLCKATNHYTICHILFIRLLSLMLC